MASDPPTFAVPPGFLGFGRREHAAISIAGIPLDIGTTNRSGARFGPQAIRQASRMLVDGAHPTAWINVSKLMLSDIGDFRIALGDIPASLKVIEEQAAARLEESTVSRSPCCGRWRGAGVRSRLFISTLMSIPGLTILVSPMHMARYSITPSSNTSSIPTE